MGVNDHDTFSGLAPLHVAAKDGDLKKLVEIMDDGADVNIRACGEVRVGYTFDAGPNAVLFATEAHMPQVLASVLTNSQTPSLSVKIFCLICWQRWISW